MLNIPNKIKHFLWRACSESLPTKKNLCRKNLVTNANYDLCHDKPEDVLHALWDCYLVKEIWWQEDLCKPHITERFVSFQDLLLGILNKHDHYLVERFAVIAWSIWYKRNTTRTGSPLLPRTQIHADALECLNEFHQVQDMPTVSHQPPTPVHCCPPLNSSCKVNFDGAIFQKLGAAGIGAVIRDHEGRVIGAM